MIKRQLKNPFNKANPYFIPQSFSGEKLMSSYNLNSSTFAKKDNQNSLNYLHYQYLSSSVVDRSQISQLSRYYQNSYQNNQKDIRRDYKGLQKAKNPFFRRNLIQQQQQYQKQSKQYTQCTQLSDYPRLRPFKVIAEQYSDIMKSKASVQPYLNMEQILVSQGLIVESNVTKISLQNGKQSLIRSIKRINSQNQKSQKLIKIPSLGFIPTEQQQVNRLSNKSISFKIISQQQPNMITLKGKSYYKKIIA